MPFTFYITLEPRSMCSLSVVAHSAIMETNHTFPVTVYHDPKGEEINHLDIKKMIWDKKRDERRNCLNGPCKNKFELDIES